MCHLTINISSLCTFFNGVDFCSSCFFLQCTEKNWVRNMQGLNVHVPPMQPEAWEIKSILLLCRQSVCYSSDERSSKDQNRISPLFSVHSWLGMIWNFLQRFYENDFGLEMLTVFQLLSVPNGFYDYNVAMGLFWKRK